MHSTIPLIGFFCLFVFAVQACQHGEIKNRCDTGKCTPSDMCHQCECYRGAWDCSYGGLSDCSTEGQYYEMGTIGDSKYIYSMKELRYPKSKDACQEKGGHLVIFETNEELTTFNSFLDAAPGWTRSSDILMGAISVDQGKNWTWINGVRIDHRQYPQTARYSFSAWHSKKPYGNGPHCLAMQPWNSFKTEWSATTCSYSNYFVCEVPKSVVIPPLPGISGPKEVGSFGNSTYTLSSREKPWEAARRDCQSEGGDLAVVNSEAEWKFILKAMKDNGEEDEIYLGASATSGSEGPWQWVDGHGLELKDKRWNWPQPNVVARSCLALRAGAGEESNWVDLSCDLSAKSICEKPTVIEL